MANRPKISVIVPIWGVEKYIEKCARSLFESTCEEMEFVFVDDCTPDHSIDVLKRVINDYPSRQDNVIIVRHEKNKGLPQARKTGFESSHGEWITFCDSDDWVDKEMYEKMLQMADEGHHDMVFCDFVYLSDDDELWRPTYSSYKTHDQIRKGLLNCRISNAVWTKIVKRSIYDNNGIYFPVAAMDEDDVFTSQWAYYAKNIGYLNECLYYHYANPESMTHEIGEEKKIKRLNEKMQNRGWIISFLESKHDDTMGDVLYNNKRIVKMAILSTSKKKEYYKKMVETYREINKSMIWDTRLSIKERLINGMILLSYPTCRLLFHFKHER